MKLLKGDNLELLKTLEDNSVDSIVTDPPYGLKFMNKKWDYSVPSKEFWEEVYRVLKPGGHVLSFGGTRTYHRMVVNLEDAGFEIRDCISWLYSTGFPKSLNIKKQFQKNEDKKNISRKQETEYKLRPLSQSNLSQTINIENKQGEALFSELSKQNIPIPINPTGDVWSGQSSLEGGSNNIQEEGELQGGDIFKSTKGSFTNGQEGWVHNGAQVSDVLYNQETPDENGGSSSQGPQSRKQSSNQLRVMADKCGPQERGDRDICSGSMQQSLDLEGLGTGLKPAQELICMARKPISEKTITDNVLKWGTGGINIDGCRIGSDIIKIRGGGREFKDGFNGGWKNNCGNVNVGRFPANIILDEEAAKVLDSQSGISKSSGASRFFYVAKVSSKERDLGLGEGFEEKDKFEDKSQMFQNVEDGSFAREIKKVKNNHPTVKPINLLIYLVRLVTPPNGIVLDPYMGSGSTGIATLLEGFDFIGMELDEDYFKIASARIDKWEEYKTILYCL